MKNGRVRMTMLVAGVVIISLFAIAICLSINKNNSGSKSKDDCAQILDDFNKRAARDPLQELTWSAHECMIKE